MFKKSIKLHIGLGTGPIRKMCPYWPKSARLEASPEKIFPKNFLAVRVIWLVFKNFFQNFSYGPDLAGEVAVKVKIWDFP